MSKEPFKDPFGTLPRRSLFVSGEPPVTKKMLSECSIVTGKTEALREAVAKAAHKMISGEDAAKEIEAVTAGIAGVDYAVGDVPRPEKPPRKPRAAKVKRVKKRVQK